MADFPYVDDSSPLVIPCIKNTVPYFSASIFLVMLYTPKARTGATITYVLCCVW